MLQIGQEDSALVVYERLVSTPMWTGGGAGNVFGIRGVRWLPDTYNRLGELYEARNDTTNAIYYYNEFVELWKDADPGLQPLVEDIRRRIGMLAREPGSSN